MTSLQARFTVRRGAFELNVEQFALSDQAPVTVLLGPSGAGKTTLLRCLAGLERPNTGKIECHGETWFDAGRGLHLPAHRRKTGCVFQDYALFPHLDAAANVAYGIRSSRTGQRATVQGWLERFGIAHLANRKPVEMSGGEQQRVALARALARQPALLLLDEPLAALDADLRDRLRTDLRQLLLQERIPTVFVTHDRTEALALGDRTGVVIDGALRQIGSTRDVFLRPNDIDVANVLGTDSVVPCEVLARADGFARIRIGKSELQVLAPEGTGREAFACIRAEEVLVQRSSQSDSSARNRLHARIVAVEPQGAMFRVRLDCGFPLAALVTPASVTELGLAADEEVVAVLKVPAIHLVARG